MKYDHNNLHRVKGAGYFKYYNYDRGYGYVQGDNGQEYFCHAKQIDCHLEPERGQRCEWRGYVDEVTGTGLPALCGVTILLRG